MDGRLVKVLVLLTLTLLVSASAAGCLGGSTPKKKPTALAAPILSASPSTAHRGVAVQFDISFPAEAKVPTTLEYSWDFGDDSEPALVRSPSHAYSRLGTFAVDLAISDGSRSSSGSTNITIINAPPTIETRTPTGETLTITEGGQASFEVSVVDAENDPILYTWSRDGVTDPTATGPTLVIDTDYSSAGTFAINLSVSDGHDSLATHWVLTVLNANRAPRIVSHTPVDAELALLEGQQQDFIVSATDPDNDDLTYTWTVDSAPQSPPSPSSFSWTADAGSAGSHTVIVTVSDSEATDSARWNLTVTRPNSWPTITERTPDSDVVLLAEGDSTTLSIVAVDPDADDLTYRWAIGGTPQDGETGPSLVFETGFSSNGSYEVEAAVEDGRGGFDTTSWTIHVAEVNQPPLITASTPAAATAGVLENSTLNFSVTASDPDDDPITYQWRIDDLDVGGATTALFGFSPNFSMAGSHDIAVLVADDRGASAARTWDVTVGNVNRAPIADFSASPQPIGFGYALSFDGSASVDPDDDSLNFQWQFGDSSTGTGQSVQHTYAITGTYAVTLTLFDGDLTTLLTQDVEVNVTEEFTSGQVGRIGLQLAVDIDGDGALEIIQGALINGVDDAAVEQQTTAAYMGNLRILDGATGQVEHVVPNIGWVTALEASDIDGDGDLEIIFGTWTTNADLGGGDVSYTGALHVSTWDGNTYTEENLDSSGRVTAIAALNLDADADMELAVAYTNDLTLIATDVTYGGEVDLYDPASTGWAPIYTDLIAYSVRAIGQGNLDGDGALELALGAWRFYEGLANAQPWGELSILDPSGAWSQTYNATPVGFITRLTVVDIDNDADNDVVVGTYRFIDTILEEGLGHVLVYSDTLVPDSASNDIGVVSDMVVGDVDGDGIKEIVVGTLDSWDSAGGVTDFHGNLYVLTGTNLNQEFKSADLGAVLDVVVGDLDGGGTPEIAVGTMEQRDSVANTISGHYSIFTYKQPTWQLAWTSDDQGRAGVDSALIVDLDGDGSLELIGSSETNDDYSTPRQGTWSRFENTQSP